MCTKLESLEEEGAVPPVICGPSTWHCSAPAMAQPKAIYQPYVSLGLGARGHLEISSSFP